MEKSPINFKSLLPQIQKEIEKSANRRGGKVERIHQINDPSLVLVSLEDIADNHNLQIERKNILKINEYLEKVLLPEAESESTNSSMKYFNQFKTIILQYLEGMQKTCEKMTEVIAIKFMTAFSRGDLSETKKFVDEFEKVVAGIAAGQKNILSNKVSHVCDNQLKFIKMFFENIQTQLITKVPISVNLIDEVVLNPDKSVPYINGIDIHPSKNIFISSTNNGGDLIIKDLDKNKETRVAQSKDYDSDHNAGSCLWSPSGDQILINHFQPPDFEIRDEAGNFIRRIEDASSENKCCAAIWLSKHEVCATYSDKVFRVFNVDEEKEINCFSLSSEVYAMAILDQDNLIAGCESGNLFKFNWKENTFDWNEHHHYDSINMIKIAKDKSVIVTGGDDGLVKCISINGKKTFWQKKINTPVCGLEIDVNCSFVIVLGVENLLLICDLDKGSKILKHTDLSKDLYSMKYNTRTNEILVGDGQGVIKRYALTVLQKNKKQQS